MGKQRKKKTNEEGSGKKRKKKNDFLHPFLKNISVYNIISTPKKYSKEMRHGVIDKMSSPQMKGIQLPLYSIMTGKIPVNEEVDKKLKPHLKGLKEFYAARKEGLRKQKATLKQRGGFLPLLIPLITGILSTAASEGIHAGIQAIKNKHHHH